MLSLGHITCLLLTLSLLRYVSTQAITFSDSEGNSLNTLTEQQAPHRLCINLNGPPSGGDLTVTISPGAATSASDQDFQLSETMFTFTDGTNELQQCFDLTLPLDNLLEQQEFIQLSAATPGSSSIVNVFILIADADVLEVGLAQTSYSIGDETESIQVCVVESPGGPTFGDSNVPAIAINVATTGDSATDGDDYTLSGSSVSFSSTTNSSGECVTITSQPDSLVEGTETLTVSISSPLPARATTDPALSTAVVSIGDSEAAMLEFQQSTLSVDEGDAGSMTTEQVCLVLSLTDGSTLVRNVEAQVAMIGGTATLGEDFSLAGSMVTFDVSSATNDERCLDVVVIGDFDYESDETAVLSVTVTMVGQAGATNSVTLTINNDDDPPPVTTASPSSPAPPSTGELSPLTIRNIGIGVGVGVGGFLIILVVVVLLVAVVIAVRNKRNSEKYVLNYSTVYGQGSSSASDNNFSSAPVSDTPDGGESGANGINERGVDVGEDANDESDTVTFKEE